MSLDITLTNKGEEVASMNWLRNPYGLCDWAEDNVQYARNHDMYSHAPEQPAFPSRAGHRLHYVVNHWNYSKSSNVNRKLFKKVVDDYANTIYELERAYYFFDTSSFIQFVLPHWNLIPKYNLMPKLEIVGTQGDRDATAYLGNRMGFDIEWFKQQAFNLGSSYYGEQGCSMLDEYKAWFRKLQEFAELLQDRNNKFYCSN